MSESASPLQTTAATSLTEQVGIVQVGKDEFLSAAFPKQLGNIKPISYGGCATAVAVHAACKTVRAGFNVYSILGYILGYALIDRPVRCRV